MHRKGSPRRSPLAILGDALLTLLSFAGAACIALVILGWVFDLSIMMFRTGSMSPTIPSGSIAVVRAIPATEIGEGDVVTVDRGEGTLPVTHRVTEILETDTADDEVTFTMRGDANDVDDPEPYTAAEVRRVMFSVPRAAQVVQWLGNPYVLGGLTLGATALVIWAFWPRPREGDPPDGGPSAGDDGAGRDDGEEARAASRDPQPAAHPRRAGGRGLGATLLVAALLVVPGPAHAETVQISGTHLRLQSTGDPAQMQNLRPGVPAIWQVGVWAEAPEPGQIDLALTGRGALAEAGDAVTVSVRSCAEPWTAGRCRPGSRELLAPESLERVAETGPRHLASFPSDEQRWLRIAVELREDSPRLAGAEADLLLRAIGAGDEIETGPDDPGDEGDGSDGAGSDGAGSGTTSPGEGAPETPDPGQTGPGEAAPDGPGSGAARADASADGVLARTGAVGVWALLAAALLVTTLGIALRGGAARRPEGRGRP